MQPGIQYADDSCGNALAAMVKPGRIEFRFHRQFSDGRVKLVAQHIMSLQELQYVSNVTVKYQARKLIFGACPDEVSRVPTSSSIHFNITNSRNQMLEPVFKSASPYKDDILALPVIDLDAASAWYCQNFGMTEIDRQESPHPAVILERDGIQIGFAINGGDPTQEGAAIRVNDVEATRAQLEANGISIGALQTDEREGKKYNAFFVVAPDGLCYYFNQLIEG